MGTRLLGSFHVFGAIVLWTAAAIHLLIHPLGVASAAISAVLVSLGGAVVAQELSTGSSRWSHRKPRLLSSYSGRALCFFVVTAVLFDRLTNLPCDVQTSSSPYSTSPAKFSVSSGDAALNSTSTSGVSSPKNGSKLIKQKGPPVFGTAFYLCRSLAPKCMRIDSLPGQPAGSVAWVGLSVNKTSRLLMLAACGATLAVCLGYIVLALLYRSGRVSLSSSMIRSRDRDRDDPHSLRFVQVRRHTCTDQALKEGASASSAYRIDLHGNEPSCCRCMSIDLYQEQGMALSAMTAKLDPRRCAPDDLSLRRASPSTHQLESGSTSRMAESALDPAQGTASTPEQVFRIERLDPSPSSARAASDTGFNTKQNKKAADAPAGPASNSFEAQRRDRYGYGNGYDRTVDFASGCIVHYPIFSNKNKLKEQQQRTAQVPPQVFPTLLPPDFSRKSFSGPSGLAPRQPSKRRPSGASKTMESQQGEEQQRGAVEHVNGAAAAATCPQAMTTTEDAVHPAGGTTCGDTSTLSAQAPASGLLSPSSIDHPSPWSSADTSKSKDKSPKQRGLKPTTDDLLHQHHRRRLGTAESARSMLSTFSTSQPQPASRPGTATSTKSNTSFRLMRRRRGLLATLDLHLGGVGSRLSGISQDASVRGGRCSYDSQRSCSAGTFGGDGASPLYTPRCHEAPLPGSPLQNGAVKSTGS